METSPDVEASVVFIVSGLVVAAQVPESRAWLSQFSRHLDKQRKKPKAR
jgi:predicted regulator of Ras-like GTPase activity (Roadblock/LC7/MglB family)